MQVSDGTVMTSAAGDEVGSAHGREHLDAAAGVVDRAVKNMKDDDDLRGMQPSQPSNPTAPSAPAISQPKEQSLQQRGGKSTAFDDHIFGYLKHATHSAAACLRLDFVSPSVAADEKGRLAGGVEAR